MARYSNTRQHSIDGYSIYFIREINIMAEYITSDTHFDHKGILRYERRMFDDICDMNNTLISNWNKVVGKNDTVYHLGDFSFKHDVKRMSAILEQLNGTKILIRGNHDSTKIEKNMACGFKEAVNHPIILDNYLVLSHEPPEYYNADTPYFYLFGHVHGCPLYPTITSQSACVCVERWHYAPVQLEKVIDMIRKCKSPEHITYPDDMRHATELPEGYTSEYPRRPENANYTG
jgi:calcineurin-like phosphoesterase family protein